MKKVIICKGLPASGKSTWAKEQVAKSNGQIKRVNKDDLRAMVDAGVYSKSNESEVVSLRNTMIIAWLGDGKTVIVDDTNLNPVHEEQIRLLVEDIFDDDVPIEVKWFKTDLETCIERDAKRPNPVGEKVIKDMAKRWLGKEFLSPIPRFKSTGLPIAIICDLDGTLAIMGDRSPYDASKCDEVDELNIPVAQVLGSIPYRIILLSGREEKDRAATERFLKKHDIDYCELYMRTTGDSRKDAVIKKEIYEAQIKDKFNIMFALDDRDQMVAMWRKDLGIPCFQVNYGDF